MHFGERNQVMSGAPAPGAYSSLDFTSPEEVFDRLDINKDGYISQEELERAVAAGAIVLDEEVTPEMWLDRFGQSVYVEEPARPINPREAVSSRPVAYSTGLGSATAEYPVAAPPPTLRPVQPEGSPWAPGGGGSSKADNEAPIIIKDERMEKGLGTWVMDGMLYRLGLNQAMSSSDGWGDLGMYYNLKNNQLNKLFTHMRNVWVFVGAFVLSMLVIVPVWNALRLLQDPAYTYFAGKAVPRGLLSVCLSLPIFYVCTVSLLFKRAALKVINEQTLLGVGILFLITLGFSLVVFSFPLRYEATTTYQDVVTSCQAGPKTRELYQTSQALQLLRTDPACAQEHTVASCVGFQATPFTKVLEDMEQRYKCAGFCFNPASIEAAEGPAQAAESMESMALLQVSQVTRHHGSHPDKPLKKSKTSGVAAPLRPSPIVIKQHATASILSDVDRADAAVAAASAMKEIQGRQLLHKKRTVSQVSQASKAASLEPSWPGQAVLQAGWADGPDDTETEWDIGQPNAAMIPPQVANDPVAKLGLLGANETVIPPYAPTLFSTLNWQVSCDGMTANAMLHGTGDVALISFYQGLMLMIIAIGIGFMQLLGMCYMPKYSRV